ncbi:MAG: Gfo/Idh/MocA family oxidoreductase [Verrucomicrobia bacterium]|nr:MAG: Gfo/Idh/MocA family oxidoreductase [Verrucomicrobiota bacterium]
MKTFPPLNRRSFLRATAIAGAPFLLPSHVWSAPTKPSDRITLGFIGVGIQGRGLMGGFLGDAATQTIAVCDVDTSRRTDAQKRVEAHYAKKGDASFKGCAAHADFREMLARKDIDAVVIATPDHWHAYIAIAAAQAGKDIYCEKPLCQSIVEARAMVNAVRKNRRIFQTGSMQRSAKEFRVACELVRNGVLGRIERIEVGVGGPGKFCDLPAEPAEPGLDWDRWLGPAPERPYNSILSPRGVHNHYPMWRAYREYGGGMVTDWGAHHFDIAQWGMGMDESGPVEILPADRPDAQSGVRYRYANGVEVTHVADAKPGNGVWFHGTAGWIYVNRGKFELWLGGQKKAEGTANLDEVAAAHLPAKAVRLYASTNHRADFLASIRSRKKPICDVETGARTVSVCHLVNLAYYHGQPMKWDPRHERFAGGTGNPEWLNVPHRGQWKVG